MSGRLVIAGSGRCGTGWAARLLTDAGMPCGHEQVFTWPALLRGRPITWGDYRADAAWTAVPWLAGLNIPVVALVRHPLDVVHSMLALNWFGADVPLSGPGSGRRGLARIVYGYRPEVRSEPTQADQCLAMWWWWNVTALAYARQVVRLEDAVADPVVLLDACGIEASPPAQPRANGKDDKKRPVERPTWNGFRPPLAREARRLATGLGYG